LWISILKTSIEGQRKRHKKLRRRTFIVLLNLFIRRFKVNLHERFCTAFCTKSACPEIWKMHHTLFLHCEKFICYFRIDVAFEIRTILYRICLLIDTHQIIRQHFISNRNGREESKIAERDRERVCVWGSVWGKEGIMPVIKWAIREIHLVGLRWD
jgi:hypothetical protein